MFLSAVTTIFFTLIQHEEGKERGEARGCQKEPPTSFSAVTSTNVGISLKNFWTFSFNPDATLVQNFKAIPRASPKLLYLNQQHPLNKWVFLVESL